MTGLIGWPTDCFLGRYFQHRLATLSGQVEDTTVIPPLTVRPNRNDYSNDPQPPNA